MVEISSVLRSNETRRTYRNFNAAVMCPECDHTACGVHMTAAEASRRRAQRSYPGN